MASRANLPGAAIGAALLALPACGNMLAEAASGRSDATVRVNTAPVITSMTATPSYLGPGEATLLRATVLDEDSDTFVFDWQDEGGTCRGAFGSPERQDSTWTAPAGPPPGGACRINLTVFDLEGGMHRGWLTLSVAEVDAGETAPWASWPQSLTTYQSAAVVGAGQQVLLRVTVADPPVEPLAFEWLTSAGQVLSIESTAASSALQWSAPAALGVYELYCRVSDAGTQVQYDFKVQVL